MNISEYIRGYNETIILNFLNKKDSYGYEINKNVKEKSNNLYEFKEATLYTVFKRLEEQELITAYWGDEMSGARRRYYQITGKGKEKLKQDKINWKEMKKLIDSLIKE